MSVAVAGSDGAVCFQTTAWRSTGRPAARWWSWMDWRSVAAGQRQRTQRTDGQLSVSRDDAMLTRLDAAWGKEERKKRKKRQI